MPQAKSEKTKKPIKKAVKKSQSIFSAPIFDLNAKSQGTINLPKEIFGQKVNEKLLAQAIRVYFANQKTHNASTKTRGKIRGGGKKPWRQKGTGRARAGSTRSPLWVGGGIALGPTPRNVKLSLPKKMKKKALSYALSTKLKNGQIKIISNLEKVEPKTKIIATLLKKLKIQSSSLFVISQKNQNLKLASRNIPKVSINTARDLNAFEIIKNQNILFSKDSLGGLK